MRVSPILLLPSPLPWRRASGSRRCEERRKTWRTREKERKTKREGFGRKEKQRQFTRLVSFAEYISSYIYDRGKSCFRRDSNNEGAHNGDERRRKDKTCATLVSRVDPQCPRKTQPCGRRTTAGLDAFRWGIADNANTTTMTRRSESRNGTDVDTRTRQTSEIKARDGCARCFVHSKRALSFFGILDRSGFLLFLFLLDRKYEYRVFFLQFFLNFRKLCVERFA